MPCKAKLNTHPAPFDWRTVALPALAAHTKPLPKSGALVDNPLQHVRRLKPLFINYATYSIPKLATCHPGPLALFQFTSKQCHVTNSTTVAINCK